MANSNLGDLSGFNSYAEWQAANRAAGGSGQSSQIQDWFNKRENPNATPTTTGATAGHTAADVRGNAKTLNLSEDQQRFDDAQLNEWLAKYPYDPATGKFTNKYGDQVDKPSERGPNTPKNMNGEGVQGDYGYGWNATGIGSGVHTSGVGGGGGGGASGATAESTVNPNDPLQSRLLEMFGGGEGNFAGDRAVGRDLTGGGVWWSGTDANTADAAKVNPALAQATLTAFTPNAPSQRAGATGGTFTDPYEAAKQGGTVAPAVNSAVAGAEISRPATPGTVPGQTPAMPQTASGAGGDILSQAVQRRFSDPNRWWTGGSR